MIGSLGTFLHLIGQNWSHGLLSVNLHGECILTKVSTVLVSRNTQIYVEFCVLKTITRLESITLPIAMDDSEYESLPTERVTVHLAAGALAGVMEHCVMYPVDCVKVRSLFDLRASCKNLPTLVCKNSTVHFLIVNGFFLVG